MNRASSPFPTESRRRRLEKQPWRCCCCYSLLPLLLVVLLLLNFATTAQAAAATTCHHDVAKLEKKWQYARQIWDQNNNAGCYNMKVEIYDSSGANLKMAPVLDVQVQHDRVVAVEKSGYGGNTDNDDDELDIISDWTTTITDLFDRIETECLVACRSGNDEATTDAASFDTECHVEYDYDSGAAADGAPSYISIQHYPHNRHDKAKSVAYYISDIEVVECNHCTNYQQVALELQQARETWELRGSAGDCYEIAVHRGYGFVAAEEGVYYVQIQHGQVVGVSDTMTQNGVGSTSSTSSPATTAFNEMEPRSVDDYFDLIQERCVTPCPPPADGGGGGTWYKCEITYRDDGAPNRMSFAKEGNNKNSQQWFSSKPYSTSSFFEETFIVSRVAPLECDQCSGFEQVAVDLEQARATWTANQPGCYEMTLSRNAGRQFSGPFTVQVQHDRVTGGVGDDDELEFVMTVNGYLDMIQKQCVEPCPFGEDALHKCVVSYEQDDGVPSYISLETTNKAIDTEIVYQISDVQVFECESCVNYQQVATELEKARATWTANQPACYSYTVQEAVGESTVPSGRGPYMITVRNGAVVDSGGFPLGYTVNDYFDMIQKECISHCPHGEGAAYKCDVSYYNNGAPAYIHVDQDRQASDALETIFQITNLEIVECKSDPSASNTKCVDYEKVATDLAHSLETWPDPLCYDFSVRKLSSFVDPVGPYDVKVRNGAIVDTGGGPLAWTVNDYLELIQVECLDGCPNGESAAFKCDVLYRDNGAPYLINIDRDPSMTDADETVYEIKNLSIVDCESGQPQGGDATNCKDWERVQAEFEAASKKVRETLSRSSCYDFSYRYQCEDCSPAPALVRVNNGLTAVATDSDSRFSTMEDVMDLIQSSCIEQCPTLDGPSSCNVTYDGETGLPQYVKIVGYKNSGPDYDISFDVFGFETVDCPGDSSKCLNYERVEVDLATALTAWPDHACYDYTVEMIAGANALMHSGPFNIKVRNGLVTDTGGGPVSKTVNDFFHLIANDCLKGCPEGSADASYQCQVTFREEDGVPIQIEVDRDATSSDDELIYKITSFSVIDCITESPPPDSSPQGEGKKCTDYIAVQSNLEVAEALWSEPPCYAYKLSRSIGADAATELVVVYVKNGVVVSPDSSMGRGTMEELLSQIREVCVADCPDEGATRCRVTFADDGHVLSASISLNSGEANIQYEVSDFWNLSCDSAVFSNVSESAGLSTSPFSSIFVALVVLYNFLIV